MLLDLTPLPPPNPNKKFSGLEVSCQVGFLDFNFKVPLYHTPTPPHQHKMKSWQIWKFQAKLDFCTSDFKVLLEPTSPPPPTWNEKFADLKVLCEVEFLDFRFQSAALPPSHLCLPMKWNVGRFGSFKSSWIFGLQILKCCSNWPSNTPPPPPPPRHEMKSWQICKFKVKLDFWTSDFKVPLYPPPNLCLPVKWNVGRVGSFKSSWFFGHQISKCHFTPIPRVK